MSDHRSDVEYFRDAAGEWRWRVVAVNGEIVGVDSQGHRDKHDATRSFYAHARAVVQIVCDQLEAAR